MLPNITHSFRYALLCLNLDSVDFMLPALYRILKLDIPRRSQLDLARSLRRRGEREKSID